MVSSRVDNLAQADHGGVRYTRRPWFIGVELPAAVVRIVRDVSNPGAAIDDFPVHDDGNVGRMAEKPCLHSRG
jgi:hypothetical protein